MKKQIRNGCFETNSSSMHSVVVTKNDIHVTPEELSGNNDSYNHERVYLYNGKWDLWNIDEGYQRSPFQILATFKDKFQYAMCAYLGYLDPDDNKYEKYYEMLNGIAAKHIPGFIDFDIRKKDICEYTDSNGKLYKDKDIYYNYGKDYHYYYDENDEQRRIEDDDLEWYEILNIGTIDHQSVGMLQTFIEKNNVSLEEFLTNKKYLIIVDGDEECNFDNLIYSGLVNKDFIVKESKCCEDYQEE